MDRRSCAIVAGMEQCFNPSQWHVWQSWTATRRQHRAMHVHASMCKPFHLSTEVLQMPATSTNEVWIFGAGKNHPVPIPIPDLTKPISEKHGSQASTPRAQELSGGAVTSGSNFHSSNFACSFRACKMICDGEVLFNWPAQGVSNYFLKYRTDMSVLQIEMLCCLPHLDLASLERKKWTHHAHWDVLSAHYLLLFERTLVLCSGSFLPEF